jgi:hypothetical protein
MKSRDEAPDTRGLLFHGHAVPRSITADEAPEVKHSEFKKSCVRARVSASQCQ